MTLAFILANWRGILAGLVLAGAVAFPVGYFKGRSDGRVSQLSDSIKAYQTREGINHDTAVLDAYNRCLELGGLPLDCQQLRGLGKAP